MSCLSTLFKEGLLALRYTAGVVCLEKQFCTWWMNITIWIPQPLGFAKDI